jgi:predicted GIY-YIG superfamily endonuclease
MNNNKTAVYRCYNSKEELIYVGVTRDPISRMAKHKITSIWTYETMLIGVDWFDTRSEAFAAEAKTIKKESPRYNIKHNQKPKFNMKDFDTMVFKNMAGSNTVLTKGMPAYFLSDEDLLELFENAGDVHVFTTEKPKPDGVCNPVRIV